jgi:hypothetical protein
MFISVANLLRVFDRICQAHFYFTLENVDFGQKMLIQGRRGKWKRLKERHREEERRRERRERREGKK